MTASVITLYLLAIFYLIYGSWGFLKVHSPFDFFHKLDRIYTNRRSLIISLTVSNISLGTGFVYLIQGGLTNGFLFLFTSISVLVGYYLLGVFIDDLPISITKSSEKNFINAVDTEITNRIKKKSNFKLLLSYSLLIVFVLVLSFEIFASSQVLSAIIYRDTAINHQVRIAIVLTVTALLYASLNGIRGIVRTDQIQFFTIGISLALFTWFILNQKDFSLAKVIQRQSLLDYKQVGIAVATSCLLAIATQFYNIINLGMITHIEQKERRRLLINTGWWSCLFLIIISLMGVFYPSQNTNDNFINRFSSSDLLNNNALQLVMLIGLISMTYGTIDSIIITLTQFYYDNIEERNSMDTTINRKSVNWIRFKTFFFVMTTLLVLSFFNYFQPNLYYLLLGIGGPIAVFTPMIFLSGKLAKIDRLGKLNNRNVLVFFSIFIIAHIAYFYGIAIKDQILTTWVSIGAFTISVIFSYIIYYG